MISLLYLETTKSATRTSHPSVKTQGDWFRWPICKSGFQRNSDFKIETALHAKSKRKTARSDLDRAVCLLQVAWMRVTSSRTFPLEPIETPDHYLQDNDPNDPEHNVKHIKDSFVSAQSRLSMAYFKAFRTSIAKSTSSLQHLMRSLPALTVRIRMSGGSGDSPRPFVIRSFASFVEIPSFRARAFALDQRFMVIPFLIGAAGTVLLLAYVGRRP